MKTKNNYSSLNIQWDFDNWAEIAQKEKITTYKTNDIFEQLKLYNVLPIKNLNLYFSDDIWDFSDCADISIPKKVTIFRFQSIPLEYKEYTKFYMFSMLYKNKNQYSTIHEKLRHIEHFTNYISSKYINNLELLTSTIINDYLNVVNENVTARTFIKYQYSILDFLKEYSLSFKIDFDKSIFKALNRNKTREIKAQIQNNKYQIIPADYLNQMISCAAKEMDNKNAELYDRLGACIIILFSQTGIRSSELANLNVNAAIEIEILNGKYKCHYMNFKTFKNARGNIISKDAKVILFPLALKAYNILSDLFSEERKILNSEYLICPNKKKLKIPLSVERIEGYVRRFIYRHYNSINCINNPDQELKGFRRKAVSTILKQENVKKYLTNLRNDDIIAYPVPHQFRVTVCNDLLDKGISIEWVKEHMNHLSEEMTDYYFRPNENSKRIKDREYAKDIIKGYLRKDFNLIGKESEKLIIRIEEFIVKGKYNIEKDLDTVVEKLIDKVPIREKDGGICIKAGFGRKCLVDSQTDEVMCAFGICPNSFHTFFMADITYAKYCRMKGIIKYNYDNGFKREAENETNKLRRVIKEGLIPELDELRSRLISDGSEAILDKYPKLKSIITDLDVIYKEVMEWIL